MCETSSQQHLRRVSKGQIKALEARRHIISRKIMSVLKIRAFFFLCINSLDAFFPVHFRVQYFPNITLHKPNTKDICQDR